MNAELKASYACSFCKKSPDAVAKMIAGPGVFICNECVDLCNTVIASEQEQPGDTETTWEQKVADWESKMSDEDLLTTLPRVAALEAQVEQQLAGRVRQARSRGITWTRIGEALGMTRQSAWERFSGED